MEMLQTFDSYVLVNESGQYFHKMTFTDPASQCNYAVEDVMEYLFDDDYKNAYKFTSIAEAERFYTWINEDCTIHRYITRIEPLPLAE